MSEFEDAALDFWRRARTVKPASKELEEAISRNKQTLSDYVRARDEERWGDARDLLQKVVEQRAEIDAIVRSS